MSDLIVWAAEQIAPERRASSTIWRSTRQGLAKDELALRLPLPRRRAHAILHEAKRN